jgi:hypothetical protein
MKVKDLIEALQSMDGDLDVHFSYNYGDHWRTEVAPRVSNVDMGIVQYSEYHRMPKVVEVDYDDEDSADECQGQPVCLIA